MAEHSGQYADIVGFVELAVGMAWTNSDWGTQVLAYHGRLGPYDEPPRRAVQICETSTRQIGRETIFEAMCSTPDGAALGLGVEKVSGDVGGGEAGTTPGTRINSKPQRP